MNGRELQRAVAMALAPHWPRPAFRRPCPSESGAGTGCVAGRSTSSAAAGLLRLATARPASWISADRLTGTQPGCPANLQGASLGWFRFALPLAGAAASNWAVCIFGPQAGWPWVVPTACSLLPLAQRQGAGPACSALPCPVAALVSWPAGTCGSRRVRHLRFKPPGVERPDSVAQIRKHWGGTCPVAALQARGVPGSRPHWPPSPLQRVADKAPSWEMLLLVGETAHDSFSCH